MWGPHKNGAMNPHSVVDVRRIHEVVHKVLPPPRVAFVICDYWKWEMERTLLQWCSSP